MDTKFGTRNQPAETTPLLNASNTTINALAVDQENAIVPKQVEDVLPNGVETTWRQETAILIKSSLPLIVTFAAQYSITVTSVVTVGHIGKVELGGVAIGTMSANITGFMIYMGMATCLDTLCPQAYGSGKKELVGLYVQRLLVIFGVIFIPISILWLFSETILMAIIPERQVAYLASQYLKLMIIASPGFAIFECLKRFMQAQGLFAPATYVMLVVAPINIFLHWLFVWRLDWGYIGAPIAVAISHNLLGMGLLLYVCFVGGRECWGGFSMRAFNNLGSMINLAIPGLIMLEAEAIAFECCTFVSSQFGTTSLAAQSILMTTIACLFQIPWPISIAGSTRIGNLVGAALPDAAQVAKRVVLVAATIAGIVNMVLLSTLRFQIPRLFNTDPDVVALAAHVLPVCAAFQLLDSFSASCNGVLRGVGLQSIGGWIVLLCYYVIGLPISFSFAFKLHWGIMGLWFGIAAALASVSVLAFAYIQRLNWQRCVEAAFQRSALG